MLTSQQPFWLGWGPELTYLYNDPYKSIIGGKHPWALGRPFSEVWSEIWDVVGPMANQVITRDEGVYAQAQLLIMERHGYQEETYYTFSYSPVPDDEGGIGGLICANTEDTGRVIGERQLALLRDLAARTATTRNAADVCTQAIAAMGTNTHDLPFALLYLQGPDGLQLAAASPGTEELASAPWPFQASELQLVPVEELKSLPTGAWARPPRSAAMLPIAASGTTGTGGMLVVGLNPFRRVDEGYRAFLGLVSGQVAAAIANAEAYEQERLRAESLAEIDRAKTTFFSNVSHEFRTPLTLMLGPLEDLAAKAEAAGDRDERELLGVVQRNGHRLLKLVNTLLDFARIEAGRQQTAFEPTDLAALTVDLAANFRAACQRAGIGLVVDVPATPERAWIDRGMWEKIVLNLLSNAFKFTLEGEIGVRLREHGDHFELVVHDTGSGIPAESLPQMFQRFHRVEGTRGRSHEGSGIGLALVQELVRLHGGQISVESVVGKGSRFIVTIPTGHAHLPDDRLRDSAGTTAGAVRAGAFIDEVMSWLPEAGREARPVESKHAARVLIADDNADLRDYLHRLLATDYDVDTVGDGEAALAAIRRTRYDLVVSDVMMPRLDGIGLVREIRGDPAIAATPVVLLSARAGEESRIEGMGSGADDYLTKPFSARELLVRVGSLIRAADVRRRANEELARNAQALREADQRKDEFIATLSHELRNPLAPIRNSLHLIGMSRNPDPAMARIHDMMERQVNHLVRLVDDLLEISRINRGTFELRKEPVELGSVVRHAVETADPLVQAGRHQLTVDLPDESLWLHGDPVRLGQVIGNVLSNAAKYTDPGGRIAVSARRMGEEVEVAVSDNGAGLLPGETERVFEMFARGEDRRGQGGLGIGLALARQLVQMHGGTIVARSAGRDRGSEFVIRLPIAKDVEVGPGVSVSLGDELKGKRVLVVDDNRDAADSLAMILRILGCDARVARDGPEALERLEDFHASIVLLDIGMPGMDGYEVARAIHARYPKRRPAIVALTGWGQETDRERARDAGFDYHLVKPAEIGSLRSLLASI